MTKETARGDQTSGAAAFGGAPDLILHVWLSAALPVGAFAYSHGLEAAIQDGWICDASSLRSWISDLLRHGSARNDAILVVAAFKAATVRDAHALLEANDLALALCASRERRLETTQIGGAFARIVGEAWDCKVVDVFEQERDAALAYPVVFGAAAALRGASLRASASAFALAFVSSLVSAALRCAPIGHTDGQRVIASLGADIAACADVALQSTLADLGGCAMRSDIAAMRHETQYSRIFRS